LNCFCGVFSGFVFVFHIISIASITCFSSIIIIYFRFIFKIFFLFNWDDLVLIYLHSMHPKEYIIIYIHASIYRYYSFTRRFPKLSKESLRIIAAPVVVVERNCCCCSTTKIESFIPISVAQNRAQLE